MSNQERWDVILKVVSGPLAGLGDQVLRGPVVRIGLDPGPGGLKLTGYRSLDARHAVITAYDGGSSSIASVGQNQVRLAPHPNVNWKEIDPISKPQYLNEGAAIHLGPVGRGCTIEFVKCQRLGSWVQGNLSSEAQNIQQGAKATGAVQPGIKVKNVRTSKVPAWVLGCATTMFGSFSVTMLAIGAWLWIIKDIDAPGPTEDGPEDYFRSYVKIDKVADEKILEAGLWEGMDQGFGAFVMNDNATAAARRELSKRENWDDTFLQMTVRSTFQQVQWWNFFRKLDQIKGDYAAVTRVMRNEGLPEVFAAMPIRESNYTSNVTSPACARGYWQFMPEVANRLHVKDGLDFILRDCTFKDAPSVVWNPTLLAVPRNVYNNAEYISNRTCRIKGCVRDDRSDLKKSTEAAAKTLGEAYNDPILRASGAVVQLSIASHNCGYNDALYGVSKSSNVLPGFKKWSEGKPVSEHHKWYGDNLTCLTDTEEGKDFCGGSKLHRETQNYVYPIVAQHLIAVCYYGQNYASEIPEFAKWGSFVEKSDSYCKKLTIPNPEEVARKK